MTGYTMAILILVVIGFLCVLGLVGDWWERRDARRRNDYWRLRR